MLPFDVKLVVAWLLTLKTIGNIRRVLPMPYSTEKTFFRHANASTQETM
jgi:hypothetical protein